MQHQNFFLGFLKSFKTCQIFFSKRCDAFLMKQNNLTLQKINSYSDDYAKTLFLWRNNFSKAWDNITPLGFDEYFKRMWEFYLSYCEAGFKAKNIDLIQFSMSNR